jgi:hypothetical protein
MNMTLWPTSLREHGTKLENNTKSSLLFVDENREKNKTKQNKKKINV